MRVVLPKTRRVAARRQHVRFDDPALINLLEAWLPRVRPGPRLWAGSATQFRAAHNALVQFFGVSSLDGVGITPASHRGGGATWFFECTDDLPRTQWRDRWQAARTFEIYVQEVAAATLLPSLEPGSRDRIRLFASLAGPLLDLCIFKLRCA